APRRTPPARRSPPRPPRSPCCRLDLDRCFPRRVKKSPFSPTGNENPPMSCLYNQDRNFSCFFGDKQVMDKCAALPSSQGRRYLMAVVLGTTLTALGSASGPAAASEATVRAVTDMSKYCTTCWRNARLRPDCWTDCTQEVFSRLMERVTPEAWNRVLKVEGEERREGLRATDTAKKRTPRPPQWCPRP